MFVLEVENFSKRNKNSFLREKWFFKDVQFSVGAGEIFGLLGPNGSGKTTLMKSILELTHADGGKCLIFGTPNKQIKAREKVGFLPERPCYPEFLSAERFLLFYASLSGLSRKEAEGKVSQVLSLVGLHDDRQQKLRFFSKGMLQKVGIAQALIHDPALLLLDEPMSGLDPVVRRELRDLLLALAKDGKSIVFSTHILHDVESLCDRVGYINQGLWKGSGSLRQLIGDTPLSYEIRFRLGEQAAPEDFMPSPFITRALMDGWMTLIEADATIIEKTLNDTIDLIRKHGGAIQSVIERKNALEHLFMKENKRS